MKWIIGVLIIVLAAVAIFVGFSVGNKSSNTNNPGSNNTKSSNILDLSNRGLTKVGSDIYSKTNATELILSYNNIRTLPGEMGRMTKVTVFKIDHNLLEGSLIGEIRQMSQLKILDVSNNNMTGMPAEIGQLSKLETLNYSNNKITGLPNELANLKNNLKEFNLSGNPLDQTTINKLKTTLPNTNIIF